MASHSQIQGHTGNMRHRCYFTPQVNALTLLGNSRIYSQTSAWI